MMNTFIQRLILAVMLGSCLSVMPATIKAAQLGTLNYFIPSTYVPLVQGQQLPMYIRYYRLIYFLTPAKADAQAMLGWCYAKQGQWPQAIHAYEQAAHLNPDLFWVYYHWAHIY